MCELSVNIVSYLNEIPINRGKNLIHSNQMAIHIHSIHGNIVGEKNFVKIIVAKFNQANYLRFYKKNYNI